MTGPGRAGGPGLGRPASGGYAALHGPPGARRALAPALLRAAAGRYHDAGGPRPWGRCCGAGLAVRGGRARRRAPFLSASAPAFPTRGGQLFVHAPDRRTCRRPEAGCGYGGFYGWRGTSAIQVRRGGSTGRPGASPVPRSHHSHRMQHDDTRTPTTSHPPAQPPRSVVTIQREVSSEIYDLIGIRVSAQARRRRQDCGQGPGQVLPDLPSMEPRPAATADLAGVMEHLKKSCPSTAGRSSTTARHQQEPEPQPHGRQRRQEAQRQHRPLRQGEPAASRHHCSLRLLPDPRWSGIQRSEPRSQALDG